MRKVRKISVTKYKNSKEKEIANEQAQYSRRNSIRVTGIKDDSAKQSSLQTKCQFIKMYSDKLGISIHADEIDIAHRIGPFKENNTRQIIVKFVRRQTKINIIKIQNH